MKNFTGIPLEISLLALAILAAPSPARADAPRARAQLLDRRAQDVATRRNQIVHQALAAAGIIFGTDERGVPAWIDTEGGRVPITRIEVTPARRGEHGNSPAGHAVTIVTPQGVFTTEHTEECEKNICHR